VDVLIRAFKLITARFPNCKLKLMGYFPDRKYLSELAGGYEQIEFLNPAPNEQALKVIGGCSIYVLASRSEGMPRVLLEAMAARKPIVASAVDGVPHYMVDNEDALLFESGDFEGLAEKLSALLSSEELRTRLATRAYEKVFSAYDERAYANSFSNMLQSLDGESIEGHKADTPCEDAVAFTKIAR
jgi:glycosyltransferase involved in cell wall biosynthesis